MADSIPPSSNAAPSPPELHERVLDNLLEGLQVIGHDYRYLYVNEAVLRHGKATREALLGRTMAEAYPGIEDTPMFSVLERCMRERSSAHMENEFTFPDGSTGWFELRFEPVPEGVAILSVDITERKRSELATRRVMRALATLSHCNQSLVRATDEDQLMQDLCRHIVSSGGYPLAWIALGGSEDRRPAPPVAGASAGRDGERERRALAGSPWCQELVGRVLREGGPEVVRFGSDGPARSGGADDPRERGFASCIALPIRESGIVVGTLVILAAEPEAFDRDERVLLDEVALDVGYGLQTLRARRAHARAFEDLEEAQARTRAIYDHLPHATFAWRLREGRFHLADFNEAARNATTDRVASLVGMPADSLDHDIPHLDHDLSRCLDEHAVIRREVECLLPGAGERRLMALTYGVIPPDTVLLHAEDVTERRRTEEQLVVAQRLEAVARLAGGVAHDFNNLLSVVLSYASFALEQLHESDPIYEDIKHVHEAGQRAASVTRQLLAFSRKQVLEPRVTSFNEVIGGIEGMMRRLLGEDVAVAIERAERVGNVMADPGQLEQIVMNLAINARDAMPNGGELTIRTATVHVDDEWTGEPFELEPGRYVKLSVTDTGTGMDEATRNQLFEPFFTTKEKGKGTGLGLSMVYGIVKQSGGDILVHSEPGKGSTFEIYLPRVDAPSVPPRPVPQPRAAGGQETILLVEDEDTVRRAAERILRAAGYRVLAAGGGTEAVRLCDERQGRVDLLLTDVVMPEMGGKELAERLAERCPGLRILFTSGYTDEAIAGQAGLAPGTRFLSKPFSVADLTNKVRQVLDEQ